MMCNLGTREGFTDTTNRFAGVWPGSKLFFETLREQGALIGVAIDPLTSHECGNQRYLAIPWLDHCLAARLPRKPGAPLNAMPSREAWLADLTDPGKATTPPVPFKEYSGVKARCVWLPDKAIAAAWYQYIQDTAVPDKSPPPAPRHVEVRGAELTWDAEADPDSGLAQFLIERDGVVVATVAGQGRNPYGRPVFQGLQYSDTPPQPLPVFKYTDPAPTPGVRHRYRVVSVNTAGLKSK